MPAASARSDFITAWNVAGWGVGVRLSAEARRPAASSTIALIQVPPMSTASVRVPACMRADYPRAPREATHTGGPMPRRLFHPVHPGYIRSAFGPISPHPGELVSHDWRNPERVAPWKPRQRFQVTSEGREAAQRYGQAVQVAQAS